MQGGRPVLLPLTRGHREEDDSDVIRHLSQREAVVLARLNASMLLNRAPECTLANIDSIE